MGPINQFSQQAFQLKAKAIEYYQMNGVPLTMETVLNDMFYDNPPDVFGYLTNYYENLSSPPQLRSLILEEDYSLTGNAAYSMEILCTYRNDVKSYAKLRYAFDNLTNEEITAGKSLFETKFMNPLLSHCADLLTHQRDVDDILRQIFADTDNNQNIGEDTSADNQSEFHDASSRTEAKKTDSKAKGAAKSPKGGKKGKDLVIIPDEAKEVLLPGSSVLSAISLAVLVSGAEISRLSLYRHVERSLLDTPSLDTDIPLDFDKSSMNNAHSNAEKLEEPVLAGRRVPCIMIPLLAGGKLYPGKQNCVKEYFIVTSPSHCESPDKIIQQILSISKQIAENLSKKGGIASTFRNSAGCICPVLDKPEQGIDLIKDALTQLSLVDKFNVVLSMASYEIFDYEKGKYEVIAGTAKTPDELVEFYADIVSKNNLIIGLIDPIRIEDREQWDRLTWRISEKCFIISERTCKRPGILLKPEHSLNFFSAWTFHLEGRNTVAEIADCMRKMRDVKNIIIAAVNASDTMETYVVDIAFGLKVDILRLGSLSQGENFNKILRWKEIITDYLGEEQQSSVNPMNSNDGEFPSQRAQHSTATDSQTWPFREIKEPVPQENETEGIDTSQNEK